MNSVGDARQRLLLPPFFLSVPLSLLCLVRRGRFQNNQILESGFSVIFVVCRNPMVGLRAEGLASGCQGNCADSI